MVTVPMKNKTLIACVTFGNLIFTKLAVGGIKETTNRPYDLFCIVGKPGDTETINWLTSEGIPYKIHNENFGFPYSINDIYDYAWKENDYEYLILFGNDVIPYKFAIDSLINLADSSTYECISATQYDVKSLIAEFPETAQYFSGNDLIINDFSQEPWKKFTGYSHELQIADKQLLDIQNLCLYKKSVFDVVGYTDVGFWPAYFIDNDYAMRMDRAGINGCSLGNARFFHFWSRTIKQGSGGSTSKNFENNEKYYKMKWGGKVGQETKTPPLKIDNREGELNIIKHWKNQ